MIFKFIFGFQFINVGLVPLLSDKTFWKYQSVDSKWFLDLGSFVCIASCIELMFCKLGESATICFQKF